MICIFLDEVNSRKVHVKNSILKSEITLKIKPCSEKLMNDCQTKLWYFLGVCTITIYYRIVQVKWNFGDTG